MDIWLAVVSALQPNDDSTNLMGAAMDIWMALVFALFGALIYGLAAACDRLAGEKQ